MLHATVGATFLLPVRQPRPAIPSHRIHRKGQHRSPRCSTGRLPTVDEHTMSRSCAARPAYASAEAREAPAPRRAHLTARMPRRS